MSLRGQTQRLLHTVGLAQLLVVGCGRTRFALPAGIVRGLGRAQGQGIGSAIDQPADRTDLADCFGLSSGARAEEGRIVVCGSRDVQHAFVVDEVIGLVEAEVDRIRPLPPHFVGPERSWFTGVFLFRGSAVLVVDPKWLMNSYPRVPGALPARSDQPAAAFKALPVKPVVAPRAVRQTMDDATALGFVEVGQLEEAGDAEETHWAEL